MDEDRSGVRSGTFAYRFVNQPAFEDGNALNNGNSAAPTLGGFTTIQANDMYVGFFNTNSGSFNSPGDLGDTAVRQFSSLAHYGSAWVTNVWGKRERRHYHRCGHVD